MAAPPEQIADHYGIDISDDDASWTDRVAGRVTDTVSAVTDATDTAWQATETAIEVTRDASETAWQLTQTAADRVQDTTETAANAAETAASEAVKTTTTYVKDTAESEIVQDAVGAAAAWVTIGYACLETVSKSLEAGLKVAKHRYQIRGRRAVAVVMASTFVTGCALGGYAMYREGYNPFGDY